MEFLLSRYRNLMVLIVAILAQLGLLSFYVKSNQDVPLIRVWAVSTVTPVARVVEATRRGVSHFLSDYFLLLNVREENKRRMQADMARVTLENQYLQAQLSTADRAKALAMFEAQSQSKYLGAYVSMNTTDTGARSVIVDRGSTSGVVKNMAVVLPSGIVGKVTSVYPSASFVLLVTDPSFAAGVVSDKHHVHGTLKGQGNSTAIVDYVQNEQPVEPGEMFYTSGDDLIFPRGLLAGVVTLVPPGLTRKEIFVTPTGLQNGLEEVLIVLNAVHSTIPDAPTSTQPVQLLPPPPPDSNSGGALPQSVGPATDADRTLDQYKGIQKQQQHPFGEGAVPNYNSLPKAAPPAGKQ